MLTLPDFPWDSLAEATAQARAHPDGMIDLSVGSPVDPTPPLLQSALAEASNAPGYPTVRGTTHTRQAIVHWWHSVRNATAVTPEGVFATIGSKEMVGLLPTLLGCGPGDSIVHPTIAYPTYAVGAAVVGATAVASDDPEMWPDNTTLVWLNSPSNPTGEVTTVDHYRAVVQRARELGAVVASDECYALLGSPDQPVTPSLLSDEVTQGDLTGLLALYSLSKQSSLAGYRAAMVAGDPDLLAPVILARRHLGLIAPEPIQRVLAVALADPGHAQETRQRYHHRRDILTAGVEAAGLTITGGTAGLYVWATAGQASMDTVMACAQRGILVAPGHFYGAAGASHVRIALTATDDQIQQAATRLAQSPQIATGPA